MQPARRQTHQSHAWRSLFKKQFHKTKLCRYYSLGQCRYANDCPFAHDQSELTIAPDLTKTTLCEAWSQGRCPLPLEQCQYAHGDGELRVTPAFGASPICKRGSVKDGQDNIEPTEAFAAQQPMTPAPIGLRPSSQSDDVSGKVPMNLVRLAANSGPPQPEAAGAQLPLPPRGIQPEAGPLRGGKGRKRAQRKTTGGSERSAAVLHLADHIQEEADSPGRGSSGRSSAAAGGGAWPAGSSQPLWPPTLVQGVAPPMMSTGASVPTPSQIPVPQMFGLPEAAESFATTDSVKLADLAAHPDLASHGLADAQTATPASTSLSSASPLRWVLTPPSAASPERGGFWDRTPSLSPARQRKSSPAYVDPVGTVTFHELPEEEHAAEPPLSPSVRWARTPSTVASPSVSPPRRVEGAVRLTNRGPPTNVGDLHRLDNIFQRGFEAAGPGLSINSAVPWGAQWPPQTNGATHSSPWGGAAQDAFERILERLPGQEPSSEGVAR